MLTQREDVVKLTSFVVNAPINTGFTGDGKLRDIITADLNPYTNQHYINLAYNIINKNL